MLIYITLIITLYVFVNKFLINKLLFYPNTNIPYIISSDDDLKSELGQDVTLREVPISYTDSNNHIILNALYLSNPSKPVTIIYSHGNAGNIYYRLNAITSLGKYGSVIAYDYRGFGKSTHHSTIETCKYDLDAVIQYVLKQGVLAENIVLFGESLGVAITSQIAPLYDIKAVILDSGFSSIRDVIFDKLGYFSHIITLLFTNDISTIHNLLQIDSDKITLIHSNTDNVLSINNMHRILSQLKCKYHVKSGDHMNKDYLNKLDNICVSLNN